MNNEDCCSKSPLSLEESIGKKQMILYDIIKDVFLISEESPQMNAEEINTTINDGGIMFNKLIYVYMTF